MLIAVAVALWFFCGLMGTHLAFAGSRNREEPFDPVHVWLAVLGPVGLLFAWLTTATDPRREHPAHSHGR